MLNKRKRWARKFRLLWLSICAWQNIFIWLGFITFIGYLFIKGIIFKVENLDKAEVGLGLVIFSVFLSLSGLAVMIKRRSIINITGTRIIRGRRAVKGGLYLFIGGLLDALVIFLALVLR
jgi:hypothetical protein